MLRPRLPTPPSGRPSIDNARECPFGRPRQHHPLAGATPQPEHLRLARCHIGDRWRARPGAL